jgi:hypothetical protein
MTLHMAPHMPLNMPLNTPLHSAVQISQPRTLWTCARRRRQSQQQSQHQSQRRPTLRFPRHLCWLACAR